MSRFLGVDIGTKRLGFALGDGFARVAVPLGVEELVGRDPAEVLVQKIKEDAYTEVVLGVPYGSNGELTPAAERIEQLARRVEAQAGVPVHCVDEHFTTQAAAALGAEAGRSLHDDALAAMVLLQEYLASLP